jgi:class 3 adenylate cyclase
MELIGEDVGGMAVHIASRVNGLARPGEVLVSGTVFGTVVGGPFIFEDRGLHELKGVPGRWPLFALGMAESARAPDSLGAAERVEG